jgi:DNA-binding IclR family transcriptional regulator
MGDTASQTPYSVPPVERALKLLHYIGAGNRARNLSTVSRDLGINRTTLIRLIHTLADHRMIEELGDGGGYRLGAGLVSLGAQAIQGRDMVQVCQPILRDLCRDTGMSAHLGVLDGRDIIYLGREAPNSHLVSNVRTGSRLSAHASSIGRAILAEHSDTQLLQIFSGDLPEPATDKTPQTIEAIIRQAHRDRAEGFAWSEGNFEAGIGSCAAAIFDHTGQVVGGINVSGPEARFSAGGTGRDCALIDAVTSAARRASAALGYTVPRGDA